ncbi:MAG: hypothetical protein ACLR7K_14540 [Subdoligranulum sp.]
MPSLIFANVRPPEEPAKSEPATWTLKALWSGGFQKSPELAGCARMPLIAAQPQAKVIRKIELAKRRIFLMQISEKRSSQS